MRLYIWIVKKNYMFEEENNEGIILVSIWKGVGWGGGGELII